MIDVNDLLDHLNPVFKDVFDDEELVINMATTAQDIDGWDSLAHIRLVVAIEKLFGLRFSAAEISHLENVGEMVDLICRKQTNV
jgi:acyl carrier protein